MDEWICPGNTGRPAQGKESWNKGKQMSAATRAKMSAAKLGRRHTRSTRRLMSASHTGLSHSQVRLCPSACALPSSGLACSRPGALLSSPKCLLGSKHTQARQQHSVLMYIPGAMHVNQGECAACLHQESCTGLSLTSPRKEAHTAPLISRNGPAAAPGISECSCSG